MNLCPQKNENFETIFQSCPRFGQAPNPPAFNWKWLNSMLKLARPCVTERRFVEKPNIFAIGAVQCTISPLAFESCP